MARDIIESSTKNDVWNSGDTVDGRNPANQLRLVVYSIIYRIMYI